MTLQIIIRLIIVFLDANILALTLDIIFSFFPAVYNTKFGMIIEKMSSFLLHDLKGKLTLGFFDFSNVIAIALIRYAIYCASRFLI